MIGILYIVGMLVSWLGVKVYKENFGSPCQCDSTSEACPLIILGILMWPLALVVLACIGLFIGTNKLMDKIAKSIKININKD